MLALGCYFHTHHASSLDLFHLAGEVVLTLSVHPSEFYSVGYHLQLYLEVAIVVVCSSFLQLLLISRPYYFLVLLFRYAILAANDGAVTGAEAFASFVCCLYPS